MPWAEIRYVRCPLGVASIIACSGARIGTSGRIAPTTGAGRAGMIWPSTWGTTSAGEVAGAGLAAAPGPAAGAGVGRAGIGSDGIGRPPAGAVGSAGAGNDGTGSSGTGSDGTGAGRLGTALLRVVQIWPATGTPSTIVQGIGKSAARPTASVDPDPVAIRTRAAAPAAKAALVKSLSCIRMR